MQTPDGTMPQYTPDSRTDAITTDRQRTDEPLPSREERRRFSRHIDCADPEHGSFAASDHAPHGRGVPRG